MMGKTTEISKKVHRAISLIHRAFMQPKSSGGRLARKKYWLEAWSEAKNLTPKELEELKMGLDTVRQTLRKLGQRVERLRLKKLEEKEKEHSLGDANEWEEDEFLDSSANLPVFNPKRQKKALGKNWVITKPIEKPKTTIQICQAVWVIITNRAIYITDKGKKNVPAGKARDQMIEKQRLIVLPHFLDDQIVTDQITGKPLMNLYKITPKVKESLLMLLTERARIEKDFRKLYIRFLKKEVIGKASLFEWAKKYSPLAKKFLEELS